MSRPPSVQGSASVSKMSRAQSFRAGTTPEEDEEEGRPGGKKYCCLGCERYDKQEYAEVRILRNAAVDPVGERTAMIGRLKESDTGMDEKMMQDAVDCVAQSLDRNTREDEIARHIKNSFDRKYSPTWHCIVGRRFGTEITYEAKHMVYLYMGKYCVMLWKSG